MKEIGEDNFSIKVIDSCSCPFHALYVLEPYYIGRYNSIENGYNGALNLARPLYYGECKNAFIKKFRK